MKKVLALLLLFTMLVMTLCACGGANPPDISDASEELSSEEATSVEISAEESSTMIESNTSSVSYPAKKNSKGENSVKSSEGINSRETSSKKENSEGASSASEWVAKPKNPAILSEETANQIKQTHLDDMRKQPWFEDDDFVPPASIDGVELDYYGTYNDCVAVKIYGYEMHLTEPWEDTVAGVTFMYGSSNEIKVWHNGRLYRLQAAYDNGMLTKDDLRNIAYYHHNS